MKNEIIKFLQGKQSTFTHQEISVLISSISGLQDAQVETEPAKEQKVKADKK